MSIKCPHCKKFVPEKALKIKDLKNQYGQFCCVDHLNKYTIREDSTIINDIPIITTIGLSDKEVKMQRVFVKKLGKRKIIEKMPISLGLISN